MASPKPDAPLDSGTPDSRANWKTSITPSYDAMGDSPVSADPLNRRNTFRCRIHPEMQHAVLIRRRSQYPVSVVDQSAGGYCVTYSGHVEFEVGQVLQLYTLQGLADVRVAYVVHEDGTTRIGFVYLDFAETRSHCANSIACFLIAALATMAVFHFVL